MEDYERELFEDFADPLGGKLNRGGSLSAPWGTAGAGDGSGGGGGVRLPKSFTHTGLALVKPMESGIDLGCPADAHTRTLLRTHEVEMERMRSTLEVTRRTCDDERASRVAAQEEVARLQKDAHRKASALERDHTEEAKLRRRIVQLERQLEVAKSKLGTREEQVRKLQDGVLDAQRDRGQLERECRILEQRKRRDDQENEELAQSLREANQARASLAERLEKVGSRQRPQLASQPASQPATPPAPATVAAAAGRGRCAHCGWRACVRRLCPRTRRPSSSGGSRSASWCATSSTTARPRSVTTATEQPEPEPDRQTSQLLRCARASW
jgi:hypothetical protein